MKQKISENKAKEKKEGREREKDPMYIVDNLDSNIQSVSHRKLLCPNREKIYSIDSSSISQEKEFSSVFNLKSRMVRSEMYEDLLFNKFNESNSSFDTKLNKPEEKEKKMENHAITKFFLGRNIINKWSQNKNKLTSRVASATARSPHKSCTSSTSTADLLKNPKVSVLNIKFRNIRNNQEFKLPEEKSIENLSKSKSKSVNSLNSIFRDNTGMEPAKIYSKYTSDSKKISKEKKILTDKYSPNKTTARMCVNSVNLYFNK
jgi:hypothetical protein